MRKLTKEREREEGVILSGGLKDSGEKVESFMLLLFQYVTRS